MPLDKKKIITKYTRKTYPEEPPMCGVCGKRITVAELSRGSFEAIQSRGGYMAYYHTDCTRTEAGGHD